MKNVLVLGGSGFVGAHVCEQLVRAGWHITVPTRRRVQARALLPLPTLTVLELDVHDEAALTRAMAGHDAVVNLVAILHGDAAAFDRVHVQLAEKIARACSATGVRQLVQVSALGVNPQGPREAPSMYLRSKTRAEQVLVAAAAHAPWGLSILRPSVIFGAEDKFLNLFARLQVFLPIVPLANPTARFQPVWVQDVALAVLRCLQQPVEPGSVPRVLEACGPEVFTLGLLVHMAGRFYGVNGGRGRKVLALPYVAGRAQAHMMEYLPGPTVMSRDNLDSMEIDSVASGELPGLEALGIAPSALVPIAREYLGRAGRH
jgi:NADH dehydrogenase